MRQNNGKPSLCSLTKQMLATQSLCHDHLVKLFACCVQVPRVDPTSLPVGEACALQPGVLLLRDVFAVKVKRRRAVGQQSGGPVLGVALFCCRRRGKRLEEETLHLHNASAEHTQTWYNTLKELLTGNTHIIRPPPGKEVVLDIWGFLHFQQMKKK